VQAAFKQHCWKILEIFEKSRFSVRFQFSEQTDSERKNINPYPCTIKEKRAPQKDAR